MTDQSTGIGDYIHYKRWNYTHYGLANNDGQKMGNANQYSSLAQSAYNESHKKLQSMYINQRNSAFAKTLQNQMNEIRKGLANPTNTNGLNSNFTQKDYEEAQKRLSEAIGDKLDNFIWFFDTIDLDSLVSMSKEQIRSYLKRYRGTKYKDSSGQSSENKVIYKATIRRRMDGLVNALRKLYKAESQILANPMTNEKTLKKILSQIQTVKDEYKKMEFILSNFINTNKIDLNEKLSYKQGIFSVKDLMQDFNKVIRGLTITSTSESAMAGEYAVAELGYMVINKATNIKKDLLHQFVVGDIQKQQEIKFGNNIKMSVMKDEINTYTDKKGKQYIGGTWQYPLGNGGNHVLVTSTAQTVDVSIPIEDGNEVAKELGIDALNMSVKNYSSDINGNFLHGIKIIETSLLETLMLSTANFANHYLNILGSHNTSKDPDFIDNGLIDIYTDYIRLALAVRGLLGARGLDQNGDLANFFVLNDKTRKEFTILSIGHILDTLDNLSYKEGLLDYENIPVNLSNKNIWVTGKYDMSKAQQRIISMLGAIHRIKIKVSFKPSFYIDIAKYL